MQQLQVKKAIAISAGPNSTTATELAAIAIGSDSKALGNSSLAIGDSANAIQENAIAVGRNSNASNIGATAIGNNANAAILATAVGNNTAASGRGASAFGTSANATGLKRPQLVFPRKPQTRIQQLLVIMLQLQEQILLLLVMDANAKNLADVALGSGSVTGARNSLTSIKSRWS